MTSLNLQEKSDNEKIKYLRDTINKYDSDISVDDGSLLKLSNIILKKTTEKDDHNKNKSPTCSDLMGPPGIKKEEYAKILGIYILQFHQP